MKEFTYDFSKNLMEIIDSSLSQFNEEIKNEFEKQPNMNDLEKIYKLIDIRYIHSLNICASLMNDYHKNLLVYLNQLSSRD